MAVVVAGAVSDFTDDVQTAMRNKIAAELSVDSSAVTLAIEAASIRITITVAYTSLEAASAGQQILATKASDTDSASTFLSTSLLSIDVESIATAPAVQAVASPSPPYPHPSTGWGAGSLLAFAICFPLGLMLVGIALLFVAYKRKLKKKPIVNVERQGEVRHVAQTSSVVVTMSEPEAATSGSLEAKAEDCGPPGAVTAAAE